MSAFSSENGLGSSGLRAALTVLALGVMTSCSTEGTTYDLAILNGLVVDPETGLSARTNVGVLGHTIAAITEDDIQAARVIDAEGHVVSPGFVDLHEHGQTEESYGLMVRDGVTSAFELEVGTGDVAGWYADREGGQLVNYGVSVGHIKARMDVLSDPGMGLLPAGVGGSGAATEEEIAAMEAILRRGLEEGAVAIGLGSAYTPGAEMSEIERMFATAADYGASAHIHLRNGMAGLDSTIASAANVGASLHIVHANSSAGSAIDGFLGAIQEARDGGQDVTTETYPYGAGMTEIQSALYDDWESWSDERIGQHQSVATGERLDRESFRQARSVGGTVISHSRSEEMTRVAVAHPLTMIASDGYIDNGRGHPRTSGSYSKVLGQYVRDEGLLTLDDAISKMTILPARRLESRVPAMAKKGRLQIGADADITIFQPGVVIDRATYMDATIPAEGIPYVIVGGQLVVDGGQLTDARPGKPVRAPTPD